MSTTRDGQPMRGPLEELTTADVLFWQEREMWSVFYHVAGIRIERRFQKDGQFGLYIGAGANFMPTGGLLEDKQIVTHHMGRKPVLNGQ